MTGIERLRGLGNDYAEHSWSEAGKSRGRLMLGIADQIERERACDADTIENVRLIVGGVVDEMEHHILGHEGMEDSPVARWARELRGALKSDASDGGEAQNHSCADADGVADVTSEAPKVTRDPAEDVSMSAYDLLPADERDAIAWVRDHGGIDYVRAEWRSRVPRDRYEMRRQRLLGHIAECETALGRRREIISNLGHRVSDLTRENAELRKRAMPEGMEWQVDAWPRFEDDAPVRIGDEIRWKDDVGKVNSIELQDGGYFILHAADGAEDWILPQYFPGERVKRPAVLAADGEPLEVGQTVWHVSNGVEFTVVGLPKSSEYQAVKLRLDDGAFTGLDPNQLTHHRPVLDADGVPIHKGDTVYFTDGREQECNTVVNAKYDYKDEPYVQLGRLNEAGYPTYTNCSCIDPSQLTHTKPEVDSWERIEEDVMVDAKDYCESRGISSEYPKYSGKAKCEDIVRRCRALAERERGE